MCKLRIMTDQAAELGDSSGARRSHFVALLGLLMSGACVVYFCVMDRVAVSTVQLSPIFRFLLMTYDYKAAWLQFVLVCIAAAWIRPYPPFKLAQVLGERPVLAAVAITILLSLGTIFVYQSHPLSMDEYAAVFQAKTFSAGRVYAQLSPQYYDWLMVSGFQGEFFIGSRETGHVIEAYWPGFSLILAVFEFIRLPWLCNPLLAAISLLLIHRITAEVTGDKSAAGWSVLFALASGAFAGNAISFYSMQAHLTLNLVFAYLLIRPSAARAFGAGLAGSLALVLHNPMPHAVFAAPWLIWMMRKGETRLYIPPVILGYAPGIALGLVWLVLRSDIVSGTHDFSALRETVRGAFTWPNWAVFNIRLASLVKLWVWACPGVFVFAAVGLIARRADHRIRLLGLSAALTFIAYLFVTFDQGHGWGYRYFHSAWGVIPILAGCAMADSSLPHPRLLSFAGAVVVLGLVVIVPFQLYQIHEVVSRQISMIGAPRRPGNNVYFIHPRGGFYAADAVQIDPLLRDSDLKLVSRGSETDDAFVMIHWPNAVKIAAKPAYDQWYLGPHDLRIITPNCGFARCFVLE